ncbi:MAG: chaperone modulator CbpM [Desulfomicrobium sp.]|nr:chaperone modulator CbpM [Pseudomonadota bacterium]MBV1711675.1 chaperone modulator CbpM [Desulfomicrobium sp.]MBU4569739.1 chaperone modulator CbpM [Pseudomonadota bacterium]MBU4595459.1 chaperone modulator CbpM [Pseudomonadota bacterium]MBV1718750.1 chaperone modulator CbpM [Desulfomicrobium sp.]
MTLVQIHEHGLPATSERIGTREFLELTGLDEDALLELVRMDWIVPSTTAQQEFLFVRMDVLRVRKYRRLCADFELSPLAGIIIVDLLERIDTLEERMRNLPIRR